MIVSNSEYATSPVRTARPTPAPLPSPENNVSDREVAAWEALLPALGESFSLSVELDDQGCRVLSILAASPGESHQAAFVIWRARRRVHVLDRRRSHGFGSAGDDGAEAIMGSMATARCVVKNLVMALPG